MAHSHAHSEPDTNYYLDQMCTIAAAALLGFAAVMMYRKDMLRFILVPGFWGPVLAGGIVVMLLALVRFVSLWKLASAARAEMKSHGPECDHGHAPGEDCNHEDHLTHGTGGAEDEHDHEHDHGWAPCGMWC